MPDVHEVSDPPDSVRNSIPQFIASALGSAGTTSRYQLHGGIAVNVAVVGRYVQELGSLEYRVSTGESHPGWVRRRRRQVVLTTCFLAVCALIGVAFAVLNGLSRGLAGPGWSGAAVKVPYCPADADGCRVFVVRERDANPGAGVIAQAHWSAAATTLNVVLPPGTYAVSAEGCTGYEMASITVSISSGFHAEVDLGANWEMPGFLGRTCPGFGHDG